MALPPPETGLVIRYSYLWHDEKRRGQEEGSKDRPCAIVLATQKQGADAPTVVVAAITHTPPHKDMPAIEIPAKVGKYLGLDDDRSWIVTGEVNVFTWPGPDIRVQPDQGKERSFAYGHLPQKLAQSVIASAKDQIRQRKSKVVGRDDPPKKDWGKRADTTKPLKKAPIPRRDPDRSR